MDEFRLTVPMENTSSPEMDVPIEEQMDYLGIPITIVAKRFSVYPMNGKSKEAKWVDRGYIDGTLEPEGCSEEIEGMECFVGPEESIETAYLVPISDGHGTFLRYAVLFGFETAKCAMEFAKNIVQGWMPGGSDEISSLSLDDLGEWIEAEGFAAAKEERLDEMEAEIDDEPGPDALKGLEPDLFEVVEDGDPENY